MHEVLQASSLTRHKIKEQITWDATLKAACGVMTRQTVCQVGRQPTCHAAQGYGTAIQQDLIWVHYVALSCAFAGAYLKLLERRCLSPDVPARLLHFVLTSAVPKRADLVAQKHRKPTRFT